MTEIVISPRRYITLMVFLVIVGALTFVSIGHAQSSKKPTVELYRMTGRLQALNLDDKWAQINGRRWELTDNFNKKDLPPAWKKKKNLQFKDSQRVWVYYYVGLGTEASPDAGKMKKKIRSISNPDEIKKIYEGGGKIYRIEVLPA